MLTRRTIVECGRCGHGWTLGRAISLLERHALESHPCPRCGSYTLCYRDAKQNPRNSTHLHTFARLNQVTRSIMNEAERTVQPR